MYDLTSAMSLAWTKYKASPTATFSRRRFASCLRSAHSEIRMAAYLARTGDRYITEGERKLISASSTNPDTARRIRDAYAPLRQVVDYRIVNGDLNAVGMFDV